MQVLELNDLTLYNLLKIIRADKRWQINVW